MALRGEQGSGTTTVTGFPATIGAAVSNAYTVMSGGFVSGLSQDNKSAAWSANTTAIQAALTAGGLVQIVTPGTYYINATLTIYSDTRLILGPGVSIKMRSGTGIPVLQNYAYSLRASPTTITLTWSSGITAAITNWVGHGLVAGNYVWLQGATLSVYNTMAYVSAANSAAGTATVVLQRIPTGAVSGTITALKADQNISIEGGMFDYGNNTPAATDLLSNCVNLGIVQNLNVRNIQVRDAYKYCVHTGAVRDMTIDGVFIPTTNSDAVKVFGPAINARVMNVAGVCGDDGVSVQTRCPSAFPLFVWTNGDCINCSVENLDLDSALSGAGLCVFYPTSGERMINALARQIGGNTNNGWGVKLFAEQSATDTIDSIIVDGVFNDGAGNLRLARSSSNGVIVKELRARNIGANSELNTSTPVLIDTACKIEDGEIILAINDALLGNGSAAWAVTINGNYDRLRIGGKLAAGSTGRVCTVAAGSVGKVLQLSVDQQSGDQVVQFQSTTNSVVAFEGCDTATTSVINPQTSCVLTFSGNRFSGTTNGVVRPTGTPTLEIRSDGRNSLVSSAAWYVVPSGTPVTTVYGWDVAIDIGATGVSKTVTGQFAFNNGAARGTITQNRLVSCNGTNWVQLDNTANTF